MREERKESFIEKSRNSLYCSGVQQVEGPQERRLTGPETHELAGTAPHKKESLTRLPVAQHNTRCGREATRGIGNHAGSSLSYLGSISPGLLCEDGSPGPTAAQSQTWSCSVLCHRELSVSESGVEANGWRSRGGPKTDQVVASKDSDGHHGGMLEQQTGYTQRKVLWAW